MKYEILKIFEKNNNLCVTIDHEFGEDTFRYGLESKKIDPETDKPKFLTFIKESLILKYGDSVRKTKEVLTEYKGNYDIDEIHIK
jgi:hypothetical protein